MDMRARRRFLLVMCALAGCLAGFVIDLAVSGTRNWTALVVGVALLPLAAFSYRRLRAQRLIAAAAAPKQD
jgi:Flp pilus assembly protein TadB